MVDDHFLHRGLKLEAFSRPVVLASALLSSVLFAAIVAAVVASVA